MKFRLIVFRPFKGEIIQGKISSATEYGIKGWLICTDQWKERKLLLLISFGIGKIVGVEFFNDILVPPELLLDGARL